jgi:sterol 14-demethylase
MFEEIARIYHDLDKGVTPLSFFFPYAPTYAHQLRDKARKEMVEIFSKVIKQRKEKGITTETKGSTDALQVFIDMVYREDGTSLNDDQVVGLLIALLFAGQHTSSITSTWTMMSLAFNPKILETVMNEQSKVLNDNLKAKLDFDAVANMDFLQNCVKESLRMYPPLILLMRMALIDIDVTTKTGETFLIPKGDIVLTSPAVSGRLPDVFKNPDKYDPERFSEERNEQKIPFSFLGFGAGRHACLGQQFGLLQTKTILSIFLRSFKIEPVDKDFPEPDYTAMVVGPKNHLNVKYTKLSTCTF